MACEVADIKLFLLGASRVGKSSLVQYFGDRTFSDSYTPTYFLDFRLKNIFLDNISYRIQLWHLNTATASEFFFKSWLKDPYSFMAYIYVFDVTEKSSFDHVQEHLGFLKNILNSKPRKLNNSAALCGEERHFPYPIVLIGNKCDCEEDRELSYEEGRNFAEENGIKYYIETSCKTGDNVEFAIIQAAAYAVQLRETHYVPYQDCILTNKQTPPHETNSCVLL